MPAHSLRAKWTPEQAKYLIEFLLQELRNGRAADNSFKAKTFREAADKINGAFPGNKGAPKTGDSCGSHFKTVSTAVGTS
jgi:hypothetical protein